MISQRGLVGVASTWCSEDVKAAELARDELLDDSDALEEAAPGSDPRPRRSRKSALVLGVLGFVTGLRVGARSLGSLWLGIAFAGILSALAFFVTRLFFQSPRD